MVRQNRHVANGAVLITTCAFTTLRAILQGLARHLGATWFGAGNTDVIAVGRRLWRGWRRGRSRAGVGAVQPRIESPALYFPRGGYIGRWHRNGGGGASTLGASGGLICLGGGGGGAE